VGQRHELPGHKALIPFYRSGGALVTAASRKLCLVVGW